MGEAITPRQQVAATSQGGQSGQSQRLQWRGWRGEEGACGAVVVVLVQLRSFTRICGSVCAARGLSA